METAAKENVTVMVLSVTWSAVCVTAQMDTCNRNVVRVSKSYVIIVNTCHRAASKCQYILCLAINTRNLMQLG